MGHQMLTDRATTLSNRKPMHLWYNSPWIQPLVELEVIQAAQILLQLSIEDMRTSLMRAGDFKRTPSIPRTPAAPSITNFQTSAQKTPQAYNNPLPSPAAVENNGLFLRGLPYRPYGLLHFAEHRLEFLSKVIGHATKSEELASFLKFAITPTKLYQEHYQRIADVFSTMNGKDDPCDATIKDAAWYLEDSDWDVQVAIDAYQLDLIDRKAATKPETRARKKVDFHRENLNIDRTQYRMGDAIGMKFFLTIQQNNVSTSIRYPEADSFNPYNRAHVWALNEWRRREIRNKVGFRPTQPFAFIKLERTFIRNRCVNAAYSNDDNNTQHRNSGYLDKDEEQEGEEQEEGGEEEECKKTGAGGLDFEAITADFNAAFAGECLPGTITPCEERTKVRIYALIKRMFPGHKAFKSKVIEVKQVRDETARRLEKEMGIWMGSGGTSRSSESDKEMPDVDDSEDDGSVAETRLM